MKVRLIQMVAEQMVKTEIGMENIAPAFEVRGYTCNGINQNAHNRAELQGLPTFDQLAGPMWDGDAIRYEEWKAYKRLSA